ncbi:MAG: outer membrane lipoprotein-sorting protein [Deltaproteobacteria bacterium]|nr:outer membrane lipoprotein-sorting protein [Deltaproteobacteria bacterium]
MILTTALALSTALVAAPAPITDDDAKTAGGILKKSDDVVSNYQDQEFHTRMTLKTGDGKVEKVIEMKIQQKGQNKRLVRFLKPGDVKGLSVLVLDPNTTYVYLPQFNKTRRVAAHTSKQSFMGTDFTEQEMDIIRYDEKFEPALVKKDGHEYVLWLTPKKGAEFSFAYIMMWIDEATGFQNKMEYYNAENVKLKTQSRGEVKTLDGVVTQTKVVMTDHIKKHSTEIEILSNKENQGLKDDLFTQRNLEWGK